MTKILVTGAKGMLGSDLCPILEKEKYEVIKTDIDNLDITDFKNTQKTLLKYKPNIIIHCAGYTDVDKAQENIDIARKINFEGTQNLAKICADLDIKIIYISTDYVFDGKKNSPYKIYDKPNPINNYGLTKLEGENAIKKYCKNYIIARTSWLYGIYGKNFVETMLNLSNKENIKVVNDQIGCPTWTQDLSNALIKLIKENKKGIFHTCSSGQTTWYNFAKEIFKLSDLKVNLSPCTTEEYKSPAERPKYSVMDNNYIISDWKIGLSRYLKLRQELKIIVNKAQI